MSEKDDSNKPTPPAPTSSGKGRGVMAAPSTRMVAPKKSGKLPKRSQSFQRTAKGKAQPADTTSVGLDDGGSSHSTQKLEEARTRLGGRSSSSTAAFVKNFLDDDLEVTATGGSSSAGRQFEADTQRNIHRNLLEPTSSSSSLIPGLSGRST